MASELNPIDIRTIPELDRLVEEGRVTGKHRRLLRDHEDVAVLSPTAPVRPRRARGRVLTEDDPLFDLIGIGHSGGPGDVSANKHRYLAEAYWAKGHGDASS